MLVHIFPLRIYYEDTDAVGVVYYANYLKFFERARTEFLRELGFEQPDLNQKYNYVIMVRSIAVDYHKPARFNDLLYIESNLLELGKVTMQLQQQLFYANSLLCSAKVRLAGVDRHKLRPVAFPSPLLQALKKHVR